MAKRFTTSGWRWLSTWLGQNMLVPKRTHRYRLRLEQLEEYVVPAPIAATTITPPTTALIGEQTNLTVTFDNTSATPTDVGYGPYVDLYLPATGKDGNDGVTFVSATYLGNPVNSTVITLTAAGVNHPYAKTATGAPVKIVPPTGFKAGDQLVVFELPFGSFTPAQPVVSLNVAVNVSNLADLNQPLPIRAQGGYQFGADPLGNPTDDPTIIGSASTSTVTPQLFTLRKEYIGPENETTTGPNYVRQYRIIADIADGQTVTNLALTDALPNSLQFVSVDSVTGNGTILVLPTATPSTTVPGGTLTRRLDSVTGTTGTSDAVMTFSFFGALNTSPPSSQEVLDLNTGQPVTAINDAKASARWDPIDTRDPVVTATSDVTPNDHTLTLRSIATQKTATLVTDTGATGYTPGDIVEYTLQVQISDYFAYDNVVLTDLLGDGLALDTGFTPTLNVSEHGVNTSTPFTSPNFQLNPGTPSDTLVFRVSDQLVALGQDSALLGGNIPPGGTGTGNLPQAVPALYSPGTTATVRFRAVIQNSYEETQPSGTTTVTPNDTLSNNITVGGEVLNYENLAPQPSVPDVTDTSQAPITIVTTSASKTVYAVNGNTAIGSPITITAGDTVTYRVQGVLPTTSANDFRLTDFLPLPLFDSSELTTLDLTTPSASPPPAGTVSLGPTDTFHARFQAIGGVGPTVSSNPSTNSATLDYGSFDDPTNQPTTYDILFTVTATSDPKADQLKLTNQVVAQTENNDVVITTDVALVEVITSEPNVPDNGIQKGVVATNNPNGVFSPAVVGPVSFSAPGSTGTRFTGTITSAGALANPINSNLRGVDAGDFVTFAVAIANVGTGPNGAFDVRIRDTLPAGFRIPTSGLNMMVTDGTGAVMPFTNLGAGASAGLFGTGIELTDPGPTATPTGALDPGRDLQGNLINDGRNIVVITYDLEVVGTITPNATITNTASLFSFSDAEGGPNFLSAPRTDPASVVTAVPSISKQLIGTEIVNANNANDQAVIGELVTYEVTVTLPEGVTPGLVIQDTLDDGLAFVRLNSVTASPDIVGEDYTRTVTNNGRTLTVNVGRVVNNNRDNSQSETVVFRYTAVVLNQASNQSGTLLNNTARLTFTGGTPVTASSPELTVIEPTVDVSKTARVNGSGTVGEAGSSVEYTITVRNTGNVDAFDVTLNDPLPKAANGQSLIANPVIASVVDTSGVVPAAAFQIVGNTATGFTLRTVPGVSFDLPVDLGRTITLRVTGTLTTAVQPAQLIRNTATVRWTSLNGNPGQRSTFNTNSTERTGSGTGPNDYIDTGSADITVAGAITKSLVSTSDPFTSGSDVTIGEIVRYQLRGVFPQGNLPASVMLDNLPAGMQFLNDGTTKIAFVSNGAGFAVDPAVFPVGSDAFVTGNETTSVTPTFVLPSSQISVVAGSGGDVSFNFGDILNNDLDTDSELVVLEFNALVLNEAANQAGANLSNTFSIESAGTPLGSPSQPITVRVVEPTLTIDKEVSPQTGDAGDRFDFVITVNNASGSTVSPAHDTRVLDALPAEYTLVPGSVSVTVLGVPSAYTDNSTGNTVDVTVDRIAPGAAAVVRYSAVLSTSVAPLQTVTNTANTTYTSLPGPTGLPVNPTGSVTPGASGGTDGERNGSGGLNDYTASDSATIQTPDLALNKVVSTTSFGETGQNQHDPAVVDLGIGEEVKFLVRFVLPEITTPAVLVDDLPIAPGLLEAISSRVVSIGSNISGSLLGVGASGVLSDRSGDGLNDRVSFNFGTLINNPDNVVDANDMIVVEITARVPDVSQNVDGALLVNNATLTYRNGTLTDSASVELVEPELDITKNITNTTTVSAGGVVDYEARVTHTAASTMDAVNVVIEDLLDDPLLTLVPGSVVVTSSTGSTVMELSPDGFQVTIPSIPLGEEVVIRYQATVAASTNPGQTLPNTVEVGYNGTPPDPAVRPKDDNASANLVVDGATVSGFVFHEQRPGPSIPIPGMTVRLIGFDIGGQPVLRTSTTNAAGFYLFANVTPGTYSIFEVQPAGFISSRQEPGTPFGQPSPVEDRLDLVVPAGSTDDGIDFNFYEVRPSSLEGFVYEDVANNGERNPLVDPGIPNVLITLNGTDWNGSPVTRTLQTNTFGEYNFTNLLPGNYTIIETQPGGYLDNAETVGSAGGTSLLNDRFSVLNLGQNVVGEGYNFGEIRPSSLSGFVYIDTNNNGLKNKGEVGIPNVLVRLTGTDDLGNAVSLQIRTRANGSYNFLDLRPGTYSIREFQPAGYKDGKDTLGSLGGVKFNDFFDQIVLGTNEFGTDYLFGEILLNPSKRGLIAR
jgi:fimbrial isopeptide formation D2 family protein/uncharacterized repeat protein (TIGR01451 family)